MKKVVIWPYKMYSNAAKNLANMLGAKRVRSNGRYRPYRTHVILNYGNSAPPNFYLDMCDVLNPPEAVALAVNKAECFEALNVPGIKDHLPEFTANFETAKEWSKKHAVVCRSLLTASGGAGMVITDKKVDPVTEIDGRRVQLWVKYVPKRKEFRLHVFDGKVIDAQEKRKSRDAVDVNTRIRNHSNGWIFAREDVVLPGGAELLAISVVQQLSLDFGAVDMIWNEKEDKCYVLEVNTAPGLEGTTVEKYAVAVKEYVNG